VIGRWTSISRQTLIAAGCIVFLGWFSMRFYMDNSNDSETEGYVAMLIASVNTGSIAADGTGHYTSLAPYVIWPFTTVLRSLTGAYQIRGFVFAFLLLATVMYAAAYAWYRHLGLGWLTSLLGLVLLSTCAAFSLLIRGWELDKLLEPALFLTATLAAWRNLYWLMLGVAVLAVINRETGAFMALVAVAALWRQHPRLSLVISRWPVWASFVVCALGVAAFRAFGPLPTVSVAQAISANVTPDRLIYIIGGLCLLPLLATAWLRAAPEALQRLYLMLVPAWIVFVATTDRLEHGAVLLAPTALLFVPVALIGLECLLAESSPPPRSKR